MASITLRSVTHIFPVGTSLGAYPDVGWLDSHPPPFSTPTATGTVQADGSVTFSNLSSSLSYRAGADMGGGTWRYIGFVTAPDPVSAGGAGEPTAADAIAFLTPDGDDNATGRSWGAAKKTLAAAVTAAGTNGVVHVAGQHTVTAMTQVSTAGVTILCEPGTVFTKAAGFSDLRVLWVTAANVRIENFVEDGNRLNGAINGGVRWEGAGGVMVRCKFNNNKGSGIIVSGSGELDCFDCEATNNVDLAATTLTSAIGTTDTTINVVSTTGFGASGRIIIDSEVIDFTGTTPTSFTGCTRATGKNPAASHASGATVDRVSSAGTVHGFTVSGGGLLRTYGKCRATKNARSGFNYASDAATSCVLNGEAENNRYAGANIQAADGRGGKFFARDNDYYGLATDTGCARWQIDEVQANNTGFTINNVSGTGVELFGTTGTKIAVVIAKRNGGYGLAFSKDTGGVATTSCTVGFVQVDHVGAFDRDPGILFAGGASKNHIGVANVRGSTYAVSFGELVTPDSNNDNVVSVLYASDCTHAVWRNNGGSFNTIGQIIARDCTFDGTFSLALVYMHGQSTTVNNNTVGSFQHRKTAGGAEPTYFVQDGGATGNVIVATW